MRKSAAPSTQAEKHLGHDQGLFLIENAQERTVKPKTPVNTGLKYFKCPEYGSNNIAAKRMSGQRSMDDHIQHY